MGSKRKGKPGMSRVEVLVSAGGEAADKEWLARLARRLAGDEWGRMLCIVPTRDAADHLTERLLREFDLPGIFGRPLRTFYDLARDIAEARRLGGRNLSNLQRALLLEAQVADADLPTFRRVQRFPGFAAALGDLIGELKLAMIHPPDLRAAADGLPKTEAPLRAKLGDLLVLYERYQTLLEDPAHPRHDGEGLMWHAVNALEEDPRILAPVTRFFFHGFRDFHRVQMRLLGAIAESADEVFIHLRHDPRRPQALAASARTLEALKRLPGCEARVAPPADDAANLGHLAAGLFDPAAQVKPPDGSVVIMEAGSPAQEAEQVAREICRLVADGRACYADIAVITRGDEARGRFAHLLARFEVPVRGRTESLGASAAGRTLLECLRIVREGWPAAAVGSALKSPVLPGEAVARARAEVRSWELGVREGRDLWFAQWRDDDTLPAREQALAPVRELEDRLRQAGAAAEMAAAVRALVAGFQPPDDPGTRRDEEQARDRLQEVIAEVEEVAGLQERRPRWQEFCEGLERAIAQAAYRPGARPADAVALHDATDLGGQRYRVVLVAGLLEKVLPAQVREDPFLRDRERRLLAAAADPAQPMRLALSTERQDEERLLFWRAVTSASERLYLTYPAADEAAKESLPSFYVNEVSRLFGDDERLYRRRRFSELTPAPAEAVSARDWAACIWHGFARRAAPREQALQAAHYNAWIGSEAARPADYMRPAPPYADVLSDPDLLAALAARAGPYHPSELEAYLTCPYLYYCDKLLELHPVEREIAPVDYGLVLHEALARLYREWRDQAGGPIAVTARDQEAVIARGREMLDDCLRRQSRFANLPAAHRAIERRRLGALLARFLEADLRDTATRGLRPAYFELQFGSPADRRADPASREECLNLGGLDGRPVLIAGRMDRVDLTPEGAAVIVDYKLSKELRDLRELEAGALVQAPLYALAAREVFGLAVAGAEYASIAAGKRSGMYAAEGLATHDSVRNLVLPAPELEAKLESAAQVARECVGRIRRGEMPRGPRQDCPAWCGYRGICRMDAWTLRALQSQRGNR